MNKLQLRRLIRPVSIEVLQQKLQPQTIPVDDLKQTFFDWFSINDELLRALLEEMRGLRTDITGTSNTNGGPGPRTKPRPIFQPLEEIPIEMPDSFNELIKIQRDLLLSQTNLRFITGQFTAKSADSPIRLLSAKLKTVLIEVGAFDTNTDNAFVGDSGVSLTTGVVLEPGVSREFRVNNDRQNLYFSTANAGDKVWFIALI